WASEGVRMGVTTTSSEPERRTDVNYQPPTGGVAVGGPRVCWRAMPTTLSRDAYERLAAELDDLTTRGRVEIARRIEEARALGDLSENGDYHAAKDTQGHMETRIRQLEALLEDAVVSDEVGDPTVVGAGSIVRLKYDGDADEDAEEFLVGSVEERRDGLAVISTESPLGKALDGRRAGPDPISYEAPNGPLTVYLLGVRV
ncbi:MAG TPA: transcription elongation factor GreA, partial [Acidimicrobiales bacterium]